MPARNGVVAAKKSPPPGAGQKRPARREAGGQKRVRGQRGVVDEEMSSSESSESSSAESTTTSEDKEEESSHTESDEEEEEEATGHGGKPPPYTGPPVYIITCERSWKNVGTAMLLARAKIRATLIVEPREARAYRQWINGEHDIIVLDADHMGVSYARNAVLAHASADEWFWILDDDITAFAALSNSGSSKHMTPAACLRLPITHKAITGDKKVAMFALEHEFVAIRSQARPEQFQTNSYCSVAVAYNKARLPRGIQFCMRVREDFDFTLQVIASGRKALRAQWVYYKAPHFGSLQGGMFNYYRYDKRSMMAQTQLFYVKWRHLCERVSRQRNGEHMLDVRIAWEEIGGGLAQQRKEHAQLQRNGDAVAAAASTGG